MSATDVAAAIPSKAVQRKCGDGPCGCGCAKEQEKRSTIHRQPVAAGRAPAAPAAPATTARIGASRGGGAPLPASARATLEKSFGGRDFSAVRVHADHGADESARSMGAQAFTVGNDIYFASGRYEPQSAAGQRLLAHELTHVVQQSGAADAPAAQLEVGATDTAAEREADRVADAVIAHGSAGAVQERGGAVIRRQVAPVVTPTTGCNDPACLTRSDDPAQVCRCSTAGGERVVAPRSLALKLDHRKASTSDDYAALKTRYLNAASSHALITRHTGRAGDTEALWKKWADKRGGQTAIDIIEKQSPTPGGTTYRKLCSPDHVIELQVGGADEGSNLRILTRSRNQEAGGALDVQLRAVNQRYFREDYPPNKFVEFTAVDAGAGSLDPTDVCLVKDAQMPVGGAAGGAATMSFTVGGNPATIGYDPSTGVVAVPSRHAVPSLALEKAAPSPRKLDATISPKIRRNPLLTNKDYGTFELVVGDDDKVKLGANVPPDLKLHFPFLSDAALRPVLDAQGWAAIGTLTPTLPILRNTTMKLELRNDELRGSMQVSADAIRRALPIPGLTIDSVTLQIGVVDGVFSASGLIGFAYGTFAKGQIEASWAAEAGLVAKGTLELRIPGIDEAKGTVGLENGRMTGHVKLGKDKAKFPGVQSALLEVAIADGTLTGKGTVVLAIPGLDHATLVFSADSKGKYALAGTAKGTIPGLKDPHIDVLYADGKLSGKGGAGFAIPGLDTAAIELIYADGAFSGSAHIAYRKGKLTGSIDAALSPKHKISGRGDLQYEIAPGLVAAVVLVLRENGTARVEGELKLPDPIVIFPEKLFDKRLFGVSIDIPIFGISFGSSSVGVILNLSASLNAQAGVGPGQIRKTKIIASFDPNDEHGAASFAASAELYVPAHAGVVLVLRGGIGVSLLIVKAVGGLEATGEVGVAGALTVPVELRYRGGKFSIDGAAELAAQPRLRLGLNAFVTIQADLFVTTIDVYTKKWKLAAYELGGDFKIGARFPVHYTFGEPFNLSLNQIEFIAPQVDARKLAGQLLPK